MKSFKNIKSLYNVLKKEYNREKIYSKLSVLQINQNDVEIDVSFDYTISLKYPNGRFEAIVDVKTTLFTFECEDSYYNSLSDEEKEIVDNFSLLFSSLELTADEMFSKFISFINLNRDKI